MRSALLASLSALLLLTSGCAAFSQSGDASQPDYSAEAETNLRLGQEAMENQNWLRAQQYFEFVKAKFPYLEASKEAELRLADVEFESGQYAEARERYESFIKLHPTHPRVDYAAFRAALTHVKDYPSEFFVLPPSEEKDQTEIRNALQALGAFVRQYPQSQYLPEAQAAVEDARQRLAQHELAVASFYQRRERWRGVVQRLESLLERYPGTRFEEQALFGLHEAYLKLNDTAKAQATLRRVLERLPGTPAAERARGMLGS